MKGKYSQIEEKLTKIKKGSIKTLIYYFSGDIELTPEQINFESLLESIKNIHSKKKVEDTPQLPSVPVEVHSRELQRESVNMKSNSVKKIGQIPVDHTNIFNSIDEIKLG